MFRRILEWFVSSHILDELESARDQVKKLQASKCKRSLLHESLVAEIESLHADIGQLQSLIGCLETSKRSLRETCDQLQLALDKANATIDCNEHEKKLLASLHTVHVERINHALASIGFSYARPDNTIAANPPG